MNIQDIMTTGAYSVTAEQSLNDAARLMWEHDIGSVPVVDETGGVIAMITDRDIAMAAYLNSKQLSDIRVSSTQSDSVVCCQPGDDLESVESSMQAHQLHRIPVTGDGGELLGIVSLNDFARAYASGNKAVKPKDLCDTLAAVCQPAESAGMVAAA